MVTPSSVASKVPSPDHSIGPAPDWTWRSPLPSGATTHELNARHTEIRSDRGDHRAKRPSATRVRPDPPVASVTTTGPVSPLTTRCRPSGDQLHMYGMA